jgi:hypothetical protein
MSPVRIELGVHLLGALEFDESETGAAFVTKVACTFLDCIRLSGIGWQGAADDWRSAHSLSIDIQRNFNRLALWSR